MRGECVRECIRQSERGAWNCDKRSIVGAIEGSERERANNEGRAHLMCVCG